MPFGDPKFTVVNPSPDVDMVLKSLRFSDWLSAAALSGGSWAYGYMFGKPTRMACANTGLMIGMTAASMLVAQNSRARLRGYRENAKEVKMHGAWPVQPELKQMGTIRNPIATGTASPLIKPPLNWKNYD
mmetsp:Transcript_51755/g.110044  ORF Transcript_51755/g.110044 Transcript_51755/m.110044 type:complete len:130 (+) Transcript_51755:105-494(+)|eukprot:CAMPEP_0172540416 /NCGR_PEP_ID=MMETSP1067-20121228/11445_1 /TAXON_ID=265564 ORGANISM="Thalassiosira punctigera, Strain Tpunct2005C2" /NCGR_SAMPLE_ID=MMETSP1067 /ASSEMBLY_ACC=CAM_ASM_000444 /LENGTH=129 /DNA_ID=CAMNT_0013326275 /DNA_START=375 /DNA_END=764 /DNA_ORIENTATION=+